MKAENTVPVHCPICKHTHDVPTIRVVDVGRDENLKKSLTAESFLILTVRIAGTE